MIIKKLHHTIPTGFNYYLYFDGYENSEQIGIPTNNYIREIETGDLYSEILSDAWLDLSKFESTDIQIPIQGQDDAEDYDPIWEEDE